MGERVRERKRESVRQSQTVRQSHIETRRQRGDRDRLTEWEIEKKKRNKGR